jgi:hypothetical protein
MAAHQRPGNPSTSRRAVLQAGSGLLTAAATDPVSFALAENVPGEALHPTSDKDPAIDKNDGAAGTHGILSLSRYTFATTSALLSAFPQSATLSDGTVADTCGRNAIDDGGGTRFYYLAKDRSTLDNSGTVRIDRAGRRWHALNIDTVSVKIFGAVGDGVTDDSAAFAIGLAALQTLYIPPGRFFLEKPVPLAQGNQLIGDASMRSMNGADDQRCAILLPRTAAFVSADPVAQFANLTIQGLCFEGGTTQVDLGLFHDVTVTDCEFRGFTVAGLCIVRGEKQKLSRLRFDFTVPAQYGLCFGYEASIHFSNGLYAKEEPTKFFGSPDAWVDRILMEQIYFQASPDGTWLNAAFSSRVLSCLVANNFVFHGRGVGDGKLIANLVRVQYSTFNTITIDSINTKGHGTTAFETPQILDSIIMTMSPRFAGNCHFTRAFNFGAAFGLTMIGCAADGDNKSTFGMYFSNGVGQTVVLVGCSGAIYSAGTGFVSSQINLMGCNFSTSNLPTRSGQQIDFGNSGFQSTIMADNNGKAATTGAATWKFARGSGNFSTPFRIDADGAHLSERLHFDTNFGPSISLIIVQSRGTPNGVITANPGSLCLSYIDNSGGAIYVKESGTGNTGWAKK